MANEPTITVAGNLTADPEIRYTATGTPVATFTIANTPRYRDHTTQEWTDGETWFVRCSAWRDLGENTAASLTKGAAVIATGRLRARSYEATPGDPTTKRTVVELTVDDIGPSLRRATARPVKTTRERPTNSAANRTGPGSGAPADDPWTTTAPPTPTSAPVGGSAWDDDKPF